MKFGYVIIYVPDVKKTVDFYAKAFDLTPRLVLETGEYAELETGATALAFAQEGFSPTAGLFALNRAESKAAGAEIGFVSADVEKSFSQAVEKGAVPAVQPVRKPWGQVVAYVRYLNGFLVEICSPLSQ